MKRVLSIICLALGIMLGISSYALENYYAKEKPTSADPASGRVNELNVHGKFVYLTNGEVNLKAGIMGGTLLFMLLGGWLWTTSVGVSNNHKVP